MIRKILAFIICSVGVILPWRLRIIYSEILGWVAQAATAAYFYIVRFLVKNLAHPDNNGRI
jgi:hypothetical protein